LQSVFSRDASGFFFISGIFPDNGFDLPDIRPDTGTRYKKLKKDMVIIIHKFPEKLFLNVTVPVIL
jgi:hypothetical protein